MVIIFIVLSLVRSMKRLLFFFDILSVPAILLSTKENHKFQLKSLYLNKYLNNAKGKHILIVQHD